MANKPQFAWLHSSRGKFAHYCEIKEGKARAVCRARTRSWGFPSGQERCPTCLDFTKAVGDLAAVINADAKIIFLDFDGVMVTEGSAKNRTQSRYAGASPVAVTALDRIVRETGAQIIVSSTWRAGGLATMCQVLEEWGVEARPVGCTPDSAKAKTLGDIKLYIAKGRGDEIQAWLDQYPGIKRFVILDDEDHMGHLLPHLIQTDFEHGLTNKHADQAIARLNAEDCHG
jgi:hypothetical protein